MWELGKRRVDGGAGEVEWEKDFCVRGIALAPFFLVGNDVVRYCSDDQNLTIYPCLYNPVAAAVLLLHASMLRP